MIKVGVLGCGNWGTTVAHLLSEVDNDVLLWGRNEATINEINKKRTNERYTKGLKLSSKILATTSLKEVADECGLIYVVIPSKVFRKVAYELGNYVGGDQTLVSCTKGIEVESFKLMSEVLKEETCCKKVGALSGPNIANEIIAGQPAGAVIASSYSEVIDQVIKTLKQPLFKVYANKDIKGVEIAGALKNIIAIAAGIATGLGLESNAKSFLVTRGVLEISRYGSFFGTERETYLGLAGMGDMVATCFSPHSRNNTFGRHLAAGKTKEDILKEIGMVVEGVNTTKSVYNVAKKFDIRMPITEGLYKILFEGAEVKEVIEDLMAVRMKYEDEGYKEGYLKTTHMLVNKYPTPEYLF
jgi:glycerol-3-phosphate dehydrogenase (NAD(P)+)